MSNFCSKSPCAAPARPVFLDHGLLQACAVICSAAMAMPTAQAQEDASKALEEVVISASRAEQRRFDAPLVNLPELTGSVHGLQIRDRQNHAQDLQRPLRWTVGVEADPLRDTRKGLDNGGGNDGPRRGAMKTAR